jgi:hypothetical protein
MARVHVHDTQAQSMPEEGFLRERRNVNPSFITHTSLQERGEKSVKALPPRSGAKTTLMNSFIEKYFLAVAHQTIFDWADAFLTIVIVVAGVIALYNTKDLLPEDVEQEKEEHHAENYEH